MKIKRYYNVEDIRRDLTSQNRRLGKIEQEILEFQEALAFAYKKVQAAITPIILRDSSRPSQVNIPAQALKDKEVAKVFSQLQSLVSEKTLIVNIIVQLEQNFASSRDIDRLLRDARKTESRIDSQLRKAKRVSDKLAARRIPSKFMNEIKRTHIILQKQLQNRYRQTSLQFIVYHDGNKMQYLGYMKFEDLEDDSGAIYSEYYIVVSQTLGGAKSPYSVAMLTDFRLPSQIRFPAKSHVRNINNISRIVNDRLANEDFISRVNPKDFPLTKDQIIFDEPRVEKVSLRKNVIHITLKRGTSTKRANEIRQRLQGQLFSMIRAKFPYNRDVIRGKVTAASRGKKKIMFILTISTRSVKHTQSALTQIVDFLGLDQKQARRLNEALELVGDV